MKVSKKQIAKWQEQERKRSEGRVANNLEMEEAWMRLKKKLEQPETLAMFKRMKDR